MIQLLPKQSYIIGKKNPVEYIELYLSFDIETTTIDEKAYMYIASFSIDGNIVRCHSWDEIVSVFDEIAAFYNTSSDRHVICWIANVSFEFQFMRKLFSWSRVFCANPRKPIVAEMSNGIEIRDALLLAGSNLEQLAKNYDTPHKKLVGDLDYSILRNATDGKHMTAKEYGYTDNDVLILTDFAKIIFDTYISNGELPLTATGILRNKIKNRLAADKFKITQLCRKLYPKKESEYQFIMSFLYRGGYNHGRVDNIGKVIDDCSSYDKTSSYPWAMVSYDNFPMTPFRSCEFNPCMDNPWWGIFTFTNIRATTMHSIESLSKCIAVENPIVDNGRIARATKMTVALCDLDYENYCKFYKWEKIECIECHYAIGSRLPKYLITPMLDDYSDKNAMKIAGMSDTPEYRRKKSQVNSYYGMCVTKIHPTEIVYNDESDEWGSEDNNYSKSISSAFLSPWWGIWICAISRNDLLQTLYKCELKAGTLQHDENFGGIYCDTDSIYGHDNEHFQRVFSEHNQEIERDMRKACDYYGANWELIHDLGQYDFEGKYNHFKCLGCKRYIKEKENGNTVVTVAGLPKSFHFGDNWNEIERKFHDGYIVFDCKLRTVYNDKPHNDIVNGEYMSELSSVALVSTSYNISLDTTWKNLIPMLATRTWH